MIDYTQDYSELLQYQNLLDTKNPTEVTSTPWVEECLAKVGWQKGNPIPGGMGNYISAVLDHLQLKKTSKNVKEIFDIDEVKMNVQSAIKAVYETKHIDEVAKDKAKDMLGEDVDLNNPLMKKLFDAAVRVNEKTIEANSKPVISTEEASSIIEKEAKVQEKVTSEIKHEHNNDGYCPRCGFNLEEEYSEPELTEQEKRNYLMHVVGGARFYKEYPLWDGTVQVMLQTPTMEEESLFDEYYGLHIEQYRKDGNFQKLTQHYQKCRLAITIREIRIGNNVLVKSPGIMAEAFEPRDGKTRLQLYIENWYNKSVSSVEMQNALNIVLDKYIKDINSLQQCLNNPDFWKGEIAD